MKGSFPLWVYILFVIAGLAVIAAGSRDLSVVSVSFGAGLVGYGLSRIVGEVRQRRDPGYAQRLEVRSRDERLAFLGDKARSMTLVITVIGLAVLSIALRAAGKSASADLCLYIMSGVAAVHFIVYRILSARY